jgi:hypothetical protein
MTTPATAKHLVALQGQRMPAATRAPVTLPAEAAKALACFVSDVAAQVAIVAGYFLVIRPAFA